jgi:hypothetical protein
MFKAQAYGEYIYVYQTTDNSDDDTAAATPAQPKESRVKTFMAHVKAALTAWADKTALANEYGWPSAMF